MGQQHDTRENIKRVIYHNMFYINHCKAFDLCRYRLFPAVLVFVHINLQFFRLVYFHYCFANSAINICTNRGK